MNFDDDIKRRKKTILRTLGFGAIFSTSLISAIATPIISNDKKQLSLNVNYSTDTYEGNKNRISDFINYELANQVYRLSGSLSVVGKDGLIGTTGIELTTTERSLITVQEAYEKGLFVLNLKSTIAYALNKNKINYKLAYVKPYYTDSSYPVVGIKLYYGSGISYYEEIFEYRDTSLYGFKKSNEHTMMSWYISKIDENPNDYFELNTDVGKIGDIGLYAKNIKITDFNLNNEQMKELKENNFSISITSLSVDSYNPSILKVTYTITYDNGIVTNQSSGNVVYLKYFDVEQGVDDPKSKLETFIKNNESWIDNLNQYFKYEKLENDENEYSAREAYEKGFIKFNSTYSINSKLESDGIKIKFLTFEEEKEILKTNSTELSVQNYRFDSKTPAYRIYISSYAGTPQEYTQSVLIEGLAQEGDFKISQQELDIKALDAYLSDNNLGYENLFEFDSSSNNPISLSDYFIKTTKSQSDVTFENGKYNIPFYLVENLYKKYKAFKNGESNEEFPSPFNDFKFSKKTGQSIDNLPTNYEFEGNQYNIKTIVDEIVQTINNSENGNFDFQLDSITKDKTTGEPLMNFNIYLGLAKEGNIFTSLTFLEIPIGSYFETSENYLETILNNISTNITNDNVDIKTNVYSEAILDQYIQERKFSSIFESASIIGNSNINIPFAELQSPLNIEINMLYFDKLNKQELDQIINDKKMKIEIKISIETVSVYKTIEKTFDELIIK